MTRDAYIAACLDAGHYWVTPEGVLMMRPRSGDIRPVSCSIHPTGYVYANMSLSQKRGDQRTVTVHRVVAISVYGLPTPPRHHVNHIDGNKTRNHPDNLEWVTQVENMRHAVETGLTENCSHAGEESPCALLSDQQVIDIVHRVSAGAAMAEIAREFSVAEATVTDVVRGRSWRHITESIPGATRLYRTRLTRTGASHPSARINDEIAREIHRSCIGQPRGTPAIVARRLGLSDNLVSCVINGKTWPHIYREFHP